MSWAERLFSAVGWVRQNLENAVAPGPRQPAYPIVHQHFVSNHPDIIEAFELEHGRTPPTIGAEFCPGFRLGGSFFVYLGGHPGSEYGEVSIVSRAGERYRERKYPHYPYLHLSLYPDNDDPSSLSWEKVEQLLPRLVQESVRVGREIYDSRTQAFRWVNELARALKKSRPVDPEELLMSNAVELSFGRAHREGGLYVVPNFGGDQLVIDGDRRLVRLVRRGDITELSLDGLKVTRKDRKVEGDSKTHHYCYIFLEQGERSISVYERYKDYYEGGPVQSQLDKSQGRSQGRLDRIARALESGRLDLLD